LRVTENGDETTITIGDRTSLSIFPAEGQKPEEYVDQVIAENLAYGDFTVVENEYKEIGMLYGVNVEYRFGALNRYGAAFVFSWRNYLYVASFTAGGFCEAPEASVYEFGNYHAMLLSFRFTR
jgi:hypothetical protein